MPIPFTQYLSPQRQRRAACLACSPATQAHVDAFLAKKGWFECEVLSTGEVSLTACLIIDGESQDIAIEVVPNQPDLIRAAGARLAERVA